jgi:MioC protein
MYHMRAPTPLRVVVFYGSQSGNAALVSEAVAERLIEAGLSARVLPETGPTDDDLRSVDVVLVCTSSHGNGELPDNLAPVHRRLMTDRPDLSHLAFAVICIGDTTYRDTYCGAGATMDQDLEVLGARRLMPRLEIDVSEHTFAEEPALAWIDAWLSDMVQPALPRGDA